MENDGLVKLEEEIRAIAKGNREVIQKIEGMKQNKTPVVKTVYYIEMTEDKQLRVVEEKNEMTPEDIIDSWQVPAIADVPIVADPSNIFNIAEQIDHCNNYEDL